MNKVDLPLFAERLNAIQEVFGAKPLTQRALDIWYDTLREFPAEYIFDRLNTWPRAHPKPPLPTQVWEQVNERLISERDHKNAVERAQNMSPSFGHVTPGYGNAVAKFCVRFLRGRASWSERPTPEIFEPASREPGAD